MLAHFKRLLAGDDIPQLLRTAATNSPDRPYASFAGQTVNFETFQEIVDNVAKKLGVMGVTRHSRVAVGLGNSVGHSAIVFALFQIGAIWIPVNVRLRGAPLEHMLSDSSASHFVAVEGDDIALMCSIAQRAMTGGDAPELKGSLAETGTGFGKMRLWNIGTGKEVDRLSSDVRSIMYTSGTTGAAKGVLVTDMMLRASVLGGLEAAGPVEGDIFYVWEPFCHIGGAEMLLFPLVMNVSLAISKGFSVSRFWHETAETGATHIHHLGGILQMLLSQPESPIERQHGVRVSWGAGATPETWHDAERRFGLTVHECYGMTETSSIITVNSQGPEYGVGFPLPWFEMRLDPSDKPALSGEIEVRGRHPGLVTTGYLNNDQANRRSYHDGWFRTGDLGEISADGHLCFLGRANDSFRVRGENVSAWQVESVFGNHIDVDQCAVVAVAADVGEQELLLLMTATEGSQINIEAISLWASDRLPDFQIPRYMQVVDDFPLTPSRRIAKKEIAIDLDKATNLRPRTERIQVSK